MLLFISLLLALPQTTQITEPEESPSKDAFQPVPDIYPPSRFDHVIELDLSPQDEPIGDLGPTQWIEEEIKFSGGLHLWADSDSEIDLALRVDSDEARLLAKDKDSGGGSTPYLHLNVEANTFLQIAVAVQSPGSLESQVHVRLHIAAAAESELTLAAAQAALASIEQATRLLEDGKHDQCRALLGQAVRDALSTEAGHWSDAISTALYRAGILAYRSGNIRLARASWSNARAHRKRTLPEDHPSLLAARQNLAIAMFMMGDLPAARALEERVLAAYERTLPEDHPNLLGARQNLANTMFKMGDLLAARALLERVLAARERTLPEDHRSLLDARLDLANTMSKMGDLPAARALEERVLEARERTLPEDHPDLLRTRLNLAGTMRVMGDLPAARALEERVLAAYERTLPEDHPDLLGARQNLAITLSKMGDLPAARALHERVLGARERILPEDHPSLLGARLNLAATLSEMGDLPAARAIEERVLAARERTLPEHHPDLLLARQNLAITISKMGDLPAAQALLERVLAAYEQTLPEDHPYLLATRQNLALTMSQMGDLPAAQALLPRFVSGLQQRAIFAAGFSPREAREVVGADSRRLSLALFLGEAEKPSGYASLLELIETRRAVSIDSFRSAASGDDDPRIGELRSLAHQASERLNALVMRSANEPFDSEAFGRAALERDRAQRELRKRLAENGVRMDAVQLDELAAGLPAHSVAVGMLTYGRWEQDQETLRISTSHPHLLAHVVRGDGSFARVELGATGKLRALVEDWRGLIGKPIERGESLSLSANDAKRKAGIALREGLLDPILAAAGEGVHTLFLCPDDLAFLVPFDALPLDEGVVGDRFGVRILTSFNDLIAPRPASTGAPSLVALGGASYSSEGAEPDASASPIAMAAPTPRSPTGEVLPESFAPLFQTGIEAEAVAALFESQFEASAALLEGGGATKAALAGAVSGKRFVHLATHGWFAPETVKSILDEEPGASRNLGLTTFGAEQRVTGFAPLALCGLALAGANQPPNSRGRRPGILTAEELAGFDLQDCELAVLSACETNVGIRRAGQGIQSLQTALHAAGARWAITSLWKVDDAYARKLMELFYTYLWKEKMEVPNALWRAKSELRRAGAPLNAWAPWVLSGA